MPLRSTLPAGKTDSGMTMQAPSTTAASMSCEKAADMSRERQAPAFLHLNNKRILIHSWILHGVRRDSLQAKARLDTMLTALKSHADEGGIVCASDCLERLNRRDHTSLEDLLSLLRA